MTPRVRPDAAVCPHGQNLLLGLAHRLGTLTTGKTADLVLCDGDPLTDIGVPGDPANIVCVIQNGIVRKDLLPGRSSPRRPASRSR
ncbi:amidohydrolase family protein [Streptomyces sp. NPDC056683]|uniref:amidohydrolase family protein n=1 Tax=Streptomyces sp. NPDC056683 TaxID=3345910 RepID=UPI003676ED8B